VAYGVFPNDKALADRIDLIPGSVDVIPINHALTMCQQMSLLKKPQQISDFDSA